MSATRTVSKCECGKRKSQYANHCKTCADARHKRYVEEAQRTVATGKCPQCGAGFRRNLAMAGWVQCEQYGAEGFRKDSSKPSCSFQCFTV